MDWFWIASCLPRPASPTLVRCRKSINHDEVRDMIRVAVLGAGGLGRGMGRMLTRRKGFQLVAMADRQGYAWNPDGFAETWLTGQQPVTQWPGGVAVEQDNNACRALLQAHGQHIDAVFMALPNLPVDFYAQTLRMIATDTPFQGVVVDALKRTRAVELLLPLAALLQERGILYITGGGATPGFLTTVAAVAAQSFVAIDHITIHFGVGVANWQAYRATIREDFLHLPGFNADRVAAMTDADIEQELAARNGLLELVNMEHADDIILELAGLCSRDKITVGGLVDTRNAKKPVSTTVTVVGQTLAGETTEHRFVVGDATTMVDNVCGPACGFLASGVEQYNHGVFGLKTSAQVMPRYSAEGLSLMRPQPLSLQQRQPAVLA